MSEKPAKRQKKSEEEPSPATAATENEVNTDEKQEEQQPEVPKEDAAAAMMMRPPDIPILPYNMWMNPYMGSSSKYCLAQLMDRDYLSPYQYLLRQQIEFFPATVADVDSSRQGRKRQIRIGQVGIRCRHCAMYFGDPNKRHVTRGAVYFPAKLLGIYQAVQNMGASHMLQACQILPPGIRYELERLRSSNHGQSGKHYYATSAKMLGLYEDEGILKFKDNA